MSESIIERASTNFRNITVLGIESSCDETAASVVTGARSILSNIIFSQYEEHSKFGGVVPELAARAHIEHLDIIINRAIEKAEITFNKLDAIAATGGPGLIGGILGGTAMAKSIALAQNLPFIAVNHLEGHALSARLTDDIQFPFLLLLISGGHSQLLSVEGVGVYRRLGTTMDDAIGEAFDKTAKLLGLGYPGGPALEIAAQKGDQTRFDLPKPMTGRPGCDFSFSGLKTSIRYKVKEFEKITQCDVADFAASFQRTIIEVLVDRGSNAIKIFQSIHNIPGTLVAAGGVAANHEIRKALHRLAKRHNMDFVVPPPQFCTDNAAMIAWAGLERLRIGSMDDFNFTPRPRWPLDSYSHMPFFGGEKK